MYKHLGPSQVPVVEPPIGEEIDSFAITVEESLRVSPAAAPEEPQVLTEPVSEEAEEPPSPPRRRRVHLQQHQ